MPDRINADLPPAYSIICRRMPETFVVQLFNHAFAAHSGDPHQEEFAYRIAWAAVKRGYNENRRRLDSQDCGRFLPAWDLTERSVSTQLREGNVHLSA